jgi:hypothetical protein
MIVPVDRAPAQDESKGITSGTEEARGSPFFCKEGAAKGWPISSKKG